MFPFFHQQRIAVFAFTVFAGTAVQAADRPEPPLTLKIPKPPTKMYLNEDVSGVNPAALRAYANSFYKAENFEHAVQFQHWAVAGDPRRGVYDLACYYARLGKPKAALFWLQKSGHDGGTDVAWIKQDADWKSLRNDKQWQTIVQYLKKCNDYWKSSGYHREVVVTPKGYKHGSAIPVVIGLHGYGSEPEDFGGDSRYQALADELGVGFIGISATVPRGTNSFVWTEDIEKDSKHVKAALRHVKDRITPKRGEVIAIGFSQGAQLAAELAARNPDYYAGAIVLCPGSLGPNQIGKVPIGPKLAECVFVIVSGSEEAAGNKVQAKEVADWFRRAKAKVTVREFEGMGHSFPPEYPKHVAQWIRKILKSGK